MRRKSNEGRTPALISGQAVGPSRTVQYLSLLGAGLSSTGLADFLFHWHLCASAACDDPRWHAYGLVGPIPVASLGL